jgi:hypothetical protein
VASSGRKRPAGRGDLQSQVPDHAAAARMPAHRRSRSSAVSRSRRRKRSHCGGGARPYARWPRRRSVSWFRATRPGGPEVLPGLAGRAANGDRPARPRCAGGQPDPRVAWNRTTGGMPVLSCGEEVLPPRQPADVLVIRKRKELRHGCA